MKQTGILLCLFFFSSVIMAQSSPWSSANSKTLRKGRLEWPLLGAKKLGVGKNMELSVQPVLFFLSPHVGLKKYWGNKAGFGIASIHKLNYPTILLKTLAREGTGGILPKTSIIPQIFTLKNEILASKSINDKYFFTTRLGIEVGLVFGEADFPEIDLPFIYRRTAVYHSKFTPYLGFHFGGKILSILDFEIAITAYKMTNDIGGFVFEDKAMLFWKKSDKFGIKAGVASAFGKYAYGNDFKLIPVIDFVFGFGKQK